MPQVKKVLEYRRARFLAPVAQTLEELARQSWGQFGDHLQRSVLSSNHSTIAGVRSRDDAGRGFFVHCARFTDGQGIGTIPMAPAPNVDLGERPPSAGENFLNSDFLALIRGNHVVCLNCGRGGGALRHFLAGLFNRAGYAPDTQQFELTRVGNPQNLAILNAVGVKNIDLTVDISQAAAVDVLEDAPPQGAWENATSQMSELFSGLIQRDRILQHLRDSQKGTLTVSINVKKGDLNAVQNAFDHLAGRFIEDDDADGYVIELRNNTRITPSEMSVRKEVSIEARANSVSVFEGWEAMGAYMDELAETGQLEA